MTEDLRNLEDRRDRLYQRLHSFGDFRLGIISETYTRCGKKNCACAHKDHPGHGPRYLWNTTRQGKSMAQHLRLGPELVSTRSNSTFNTSFRPEENSSVRPRLGPLSMVFIALVRLW